MHGEALLGAAVSVETPDAQQDALALIGSVSFIFVEAGHAPMITAENILAAAQGTPTRLAVTCRSASEVNGLAFALQVGVDALVVSDDCLDAADFVEALEIAKAQRLERIGAVGHEEQLSATLEPIAVELLQARVTNVMPGGIADRVCLDLTRLLDEGEGCLLGSSAKKLALVLGETALSGYVPPRPFRVNAGPVHQYVLLADMSTKYLSEVVSGDAVLCVRASDGRCRACVVGRCKVEPRPMLRVEFATPDGERGQLFLQQAETVRLATTSGPLSVTRVRVSNDPEILVRLAIRGTHVGRSIDAIVLER